MKGGKQTFRVMISLTARPAVRVRPGSSLSFSLARIKLCASRNFGPSFSYSVPTLVYEAAAWGQV